MMQIHLYCPVCMAEQKKKGQNVDFQGNEPIKSVVYEPSNEGIYTVQCKKGHVGVDILNNLHFELLFDLGINAIGDGYYREAIASTTASLERFYEFFVKTVWRAQCLEFELIDKNWKEMTSQSERQLGAYIVAYSSTFREVAPMMSNKQKEFRNDVIHKGVIPTREKTIKYVKTILELIDGPLEKLQKKYLGVVNETFARYAPPYKALNENENVLIINHPTIIQAREPLQEDDMRKNRDIEYYVEMVMNDRTPMKMRLVDDVGKVMMTEHYDEWLSKKLSCLNQEIEENEFKIVVNPDASVEDCLNKMEEQLTNYDFIFDYLQMNHREVFSTETKILLFNSQSLARLYYLYLKVKVFQLLLNSNPKDEQLKLKYEQAELELRVFHNGASYCD